MPKTLLAKYHTNAETGFLLRHVRSETERFSLHDHDYFEFFLVLSGKATHAVNGGRFPISAGTLIFVRPRDLHDYCEYEATGLEFLNLAFSVELFDAVCAYFGAAFDLRTLTDPVYPPEARLSAEETDKLHMRLAALLAIAPADVERAGIRIRVLLADLFTSYFCETGDSARNVPLWLEQAYKRMRKPANFIAGKHRFFDLCGRSREYATRALKMYYGVTPTELVNDLRLTYAANLLRSGNLTALEICYAAGFGNLSNFYTEFEKKYRVTPKEYRKE